MALSLPLFTLSVFYFVGEQSPLLGEFFIEAPPIEVSCSLGGFQEFSHLGSALFNGPSEGHQSS
jgi:hypothetical protein